MIVIHVSVSVKEGFSEQFIDATLRKRKGCLSEPGILGFEILLEEGSSTEFLLVEKYRNDDDVHQHKETVCYLTWRDTVEPYMKRPRNHMVFHVIKGESDEFFSNE